MILNNFKFCSQSAAVCQIFGITLLNQLQSFIFETHFENLFLFFDICLTICTFLNLGHYITFLSRFFKLSLTIILLDVQTERFLLQQLRKHIS